MAGNTGLKTKAFEVAYDLYNRDLLNSSEYKAICDGLNEIETLRDRDKELEKLWAELTDVPMNPETGCINKEFMGFPAGTHQETIWRWFDERHSLGVAYLRGCYERDREKANKLLALGDICEECDRQCCYNRRGVCRFPLVHERRPRINDVDGCIDYDYQGEK